MDRRDSCRLNKLVFNDSKGARMASYFDFDVKNKIIRCRLVGLVTDDSLREHYRTIAQHVVARASRSLWLSERTYLEGLLRAGRFVK